MRPVILYDYDRQTVVRHCLELILYDRPDYATHYPRSVKQAVVILRQQFGFSHKDLAKMCGTKYPSSIRNIVKNFREGEKISWK